MGCRTQKQKQGECTECDRYELCIQYVGSQAGEDAKPMQSLVEQIKAKAEAETAKAAGRQRRNFEPETAQTSTRKSHVEPTDEAERRTEEPTDNNPEEGCGNGSKDIADGVEPKLIQQLSTRVLCKLDTPKALEDLLTCW